MRDHFEQRDPSRNRQFYRRFSSSLPPTPAQIELNRLRHELGNIEAAREFQKRVRRGGVQV